MPLLILLLLAAIIMAGSSAAAGFFIARQIEPVAPAPPGSIAAPREELWTPEWAFYARASPPVGNSSEGSVAVLLTYLQQPADNATATPGIPIEVAAVTWEYGWPDEVNPSYSATGPNLLADVNQRLRDSPSVAFTRASISRHGDGVELAIPSEVNATTILVHAPETQRFVFIDWPSGRPYEYASGDAAGWRWLDERLPAILARGPG